MNWLKVPRKTLISDLITGLVMAVVQVPSAVANGLLAGVNPVFGLYSMIAGTTVVAILTSYTVAVLQEVVSYLNTFGLLLPLLTIVVFVTEVWVSLWRRQTTMWIGIATTIAMFISLIVFSGARSSALTLVQDPFLRELGRAILNVLTHGLMVQTLFLMIVGVLLIIGAWQAAPDSALMKWEAAQT
jgi:MFS superfamily sulfate permease-like transporter